MEIKCKVDGCDRDATYKGQKVCQMHYFRMMRTGTYAPRKKLKKHITPNGYVKILAEGHPMADKNGYAFEHRYVLYEHTSGKNQKCEFCGAAWEWRPYKDHVDHIDEDRLNNKIENLRPLCNTCNTSRTKVNYSESKGCVPITAFGKTLVSTEWEHEQECKVASFTLRQRIKAGWDAEKAITTPSRKRQREA